MKYKELWKKTDMKYRISVFLICALVLGVVGVKSVQGYQNNSEQAPKIVNEAGGIINYAEAENVPQEQIEEVFGASATDYSSRQFIDVNGDVVYHLKMQFKDATTTIVSFTDPFLTASSTSSASPVLRTDGSIQWIGATSTVELVQLIQTGAATTSFWVECGAASDPTATSSVDLLYSGTVGTSTNGNYFENGLTSVMGLSAGASSTSTPKIVLTPTYPYFTCKVHADDYTDMTPFTQSSNTFDGYGMIQVRRMRF